MTSLWCLTILLLMTCSTSSADDKNLATTVYSDAFLKLLNLLNGNFSDHRVVNAFKAMDDPDLEIPSTVYFYNIPVEIPAMAPAVTYFTEEYFEHHLRRRLILVVWEDQKGEIYLQPYNITSPPNDRSKPFSIDQVKKLTASDLTTREECKVKFQRKGTQTFTALWPDCTVNDNGIVPNFRLTYSCNSVVGTATDSDQTEYSPIPVVFTREGTRYPFPSYLNEANDKVAC
ncbi:uncharacterized protein LOC131954267 [Physella acuta]|uniref:uncharacterized protein LOC131954267 n=1 Tax=Physella acuta TaxID=109671 RepID=UPI0027DDE498|nr:uncharacterized protein LOC131954267 [Physella acuta]